MSRRITTALFLAGGAASAVLAVAGPASAASATHSNDYTTTGTFSNTYTLDASGSNHDLQQPYLVPPPAGCVIDTNQVSLVPHTSRGPAGIDNQSVNEWGVGWTSWAAAAGGFPIGHHSGHIDVDLTFVYYC